MDELQRLVNATLPPVVHLDTLWHLKWFFNSVNNPRPNWGGYLQTTVTHTGKKTVAVVVTMLPMIDMKSTDSSRNYSTLCFIADQARQLNIPTPVINFDQPLWLKAVEITKAAGLDIVCCLGCFHIIKSFLGAMGTVMAGCGIEELLGQIYFANTVAHMMHGIAA